MDESACQIAHRLTFEDRQSTYGHPLDDFTRTAALASAMLAHKLKEPLTPEEAAMFLVLVKISREVHLHKRDNLIDGAGYFNVVDLIHRERERRAPTDDTNFNK